VGLPGEALDDDGASTKMAWLEGSVLARGALAVVLITHHHPASAGGLVGARRRRHRAPLARQLVADLVQLAVLRVRRADVNQRKIHTYSQQHVTLYTYIRYQH
jgi:glyoxylase-like metal-dependent hydrolase (beta-lactamase superfamily II)